MRRRSGLVVALAGFALASACSEMPPTEPGGLRPSEANLFRGPAGDPSAFAGTLDAHFVRMAQENPGFAGLYYDASGALVIRTAGIGTMSARALEAPLSAIGVDLAAQVVRYEAATYDFIQLDAMHRSLTPVLQLNGVVYTDADEVRNTVTVGVSTAAARRAVERAAGMLGLPGDAVTIVDAAPIHTEQSLQSHVRPVAGGLQINFTRGDPPAGFLCTHGFNVRTMTGNVQGFVTNSHCSDTRSVMLNTPYWQHSRFAENTFIGNEVHDLPFFQGGVCPAGRNCRWSDSLGALYAPGVEQAFGQIYRTLFPGTTAAGSLEIDPANPRWQIVDELPHAIVGQTLHKTGRTSGWTTGPVTATCSNSNVAGDGFVTMLCQDRIQTQSAGGDSGSPYFVRIGDTNNVALIGIHWGSGAGITVSSPMRNIRFENQGPAPWVTFPGQVPPPPSQPGT